MTLFMNILLITFNFKKMSTSKTSNDLNPTSSTTSTTTLNATSATTSTTTLNATSATTSTTTLNATSVTTSTTVLNVTSATSTTATPVTWSDQEIRLLINQRKNRNVEYYRIHGRSRTDFWDSVARRINRAAGSNFTGKQCKRKFQSLVSIYYVSKNDK